MSEIIPINVGGEMVSPEEVASILEGTMGTSAGGLDDLAIYRQGKEDYFKSGDDKISSVWGILLVSMRPGRAWWESNTLDGSAPDCFSHDGVKPHALAKAQSENCADCPFDQLGTAHVGKGKACKTKASDFILQVRPDFGCETGGSTPKALISQADLVGPALVQYSISNSVSTRAFSSFVRGTREAGTLPQGVIGKWGWETSQSKSGVEYSACKLTIEAVLPTPQESPELWGLIIKEVKNLKGGHALQILDMLTGQQDD